MQRSFAFSLATVAMVLVVAPEGLRAAPLGKVTIDGNPLEDKDRLQRFLGLYVGAEMGGKDALASRVAETLRSLSYDAEVAATEGPSGIELRITVEPAQLVRHVRVRGNWPVLEDDVKRRLTLRPGSPLPPAPQRKAALEAEGARVRDYLRRDGFFEAEVTVSIRPAGKPEWVDLDIRVRRGRWFELKEVLVEGATVIPPREFLRIFGSARPWLFGRLRLDGLRDDARAAEAEYRERGYPVARVTAELDKTQPIIAGTNQARLSVRVSEKSRVDVRFTGNRNISDRDLRDKLTIFTTGSYDEVELEQSQRELARLYQSRGYLEARVTFTRRRTGDLEDVTFAIDEGPVLKVRAVEVAAEPGAPPLSDDDLEAIKTVLATRTFERIGDLGIISTGGGFVTTLQAQQDADKIAAWARGAGCPDPRVRVELSRAPEALGRLGVLAADVAEEIGRGSDVYVRFTIDKGRCETLGEITVEFSGIHQRTAADLIKEIALPPGSPYDRDALSAALRRLTEKYAGAGHPYALIRPPRLDWNEEHSRVRVNLVVDEGPEVRFGEILVRGNFKTQEWVIRRNLPFKTGDLFDFEKLAEAERNLQTHAIFNGVRVVPVGISGGNVNPVPILIEVQQERHDDRGNFVASIGYSSDVGGLLLAPGYFWGNVWGWGGNVDLRLEAGLDLSQTPAIDPGAAFWRRLSATLRYVHPHFVVPPLRLEFAGFGRKETTVRLGDIVSAGTQLSLSYIVSPTVRVFGRYEFTYSSLQSLALQRTAGRNDSITSTADVTRTGKLTLGLVYDNRTSFEGARNPLMPLKGLLAAATFALASVGLGGTANFAIVAGQIQGYIPAGPLTFILALRADWGIPLFGGEIPAVDRFYAGGDVATRGYETDKLLVEQIKTGVVGGVNAYRIVPRGGNVRVLGTVEAQFQFTKIGGIPWAGAIFTDAGTLFDRPDTWSPDDIRVSVGVSVLRLLTPVGPISLDYAYPLVQNAVEREWKSQGAQRHWPGLIHFNWGIPILR